MQAPAAGTPATMTVTCPNCRQVSQGYLGMVVACPFCQNHMQIPAAGPAAGHAPQPQPQHRSHSVGGAPGQPQWQPGHTPVGLQPVQGYSGAPAPPPKLTGRKKALLIGINYRGTSAELRGCINDVRRMKDLLRHNGFSESPQEMVVLTDEMRDPNFQPTKQNILNAMAWLTGGCQPGDILFFHFSGHGGQQEDPQGAEEDGMDETIVPSDFKRAGQITDDQIFMHLVWPLPSGVRLTAVMDCCHSGTGLDLPFTWEYGRWAEDTNPFHSLGDVQLFSGCEDDQCSADASMYGRSGGAMTTAFIEAIQKHPHQNYPQLLQTLHRNLAKHGFTQRPVLSASQAFDPNRPFSLQDIHPNMNPQVGRKFRKRKSPRRQFGGGLDSMLLGAGVGLLAYAAAPMMFDAAAGMVGLGGDMIGGAVDGIADIGGGIGDFMGDLF